MCHKIYKKSGEFKLGENPNLKNKKKHVTVVIMIN